jgi:stress-induced morphogen
MRTDETRMIEELLRKTFPQADAYRYNSASIRVRVVDPRFKGKSTERRHAMVESLLEQLPRETQAEIMNLVTLYPDETEGSFEALALNEEFEEPSPSRL